MKKQSLPFFCPLDDSRILILRRQILRDVCSSDAGFSTRPVSSIKHETLERILTLYDELFFSGFLVNKLPGIKVSLSSRMTSSAGKFICLRGPFRKIRQAEIRMSSDFIFRLKDGPFELNGLSADSPQEAFLIVFEHELCHAIETVLFGATGHSSRFMALANGLFGHTATRHRLPTRRQEAFDSGLKIGCCVSFSDHGQIKSGVITYVGKMATVMVPSVQGEYRDRNGRRYVKYRIPLSKLTII